MALSKAPHSLDLGNLAGTSQGEVAVLCERGQTSAWLSRGCSGPRPSCASGHLHPVAGQDACSGMRADLGHHGDMGAAGRKDMQEVLPASLSSFKALLSYRPSEPHAGRGLCRSGTRAASWCAGRPRPCRVSAAPAPGRSTRLHPGGPKSRAEAAASTGAPPWVAAQKRQLHLHAPPTSPPLIPRVARGCWAAGLQSAWTSVTGLPSLVTTGVLCIGAAKHRPAREVWPGVF